MKLLISFFLFFSIFTLQVIANLSSEKPLDQEQSWEMQRCQSAINQYPFKGNETILDLCSGNGATCSYLASKVPHGNVLGIDVSNSLTFFADKKYKASNLRFQIAKIADLSFENQFDLVTSFNAMHLVGEPKAVWSCIMRSLKPGGKVLMQFPIDDGFHGALQETMYLPQWRKYFGSFSSGWHFYLPEEYKKIVTHAGLIVKKIEKVPYQETFSSKEEFFSNLALWLPHLIPLSETKKTEFLNDFFIIYNKKYSSKDEKILYKFHNIFLEAEKPEN